MHVSDMINKVAVHSLTTRQAKFVKWLHSHSTMFVELSKPVMLQPLVLQLPRPSEFKM